MNGIQLQNNVKYCFCKIVCLFLSLCLFQVPNDDCIGKCGGETFKSESPSKCCTSFVFQRVASRSLAALQQRRQQIISQLEKVVGKSAASAISSSAGSQARVVRTVLMANTVISFAE